MGGLPHLEANECWFLRWLVVKISQHWLASNLFLRASILLFCMDEVGYASHWHPAMWCCHDVASPLVVMPSLCCRNLPSLYEAWSTLVPQHLRNRYTCSELPMLVNLSFSHSHTPLEFVSKWIKKQSLLHCVHVFMACDFHLLGMLCMVDCVLSAASVLGMVDCVLSAARVQGILSCVLLIASVLGGQWELIYMYFNLLANQLRTVLITWHTCVYCMRLSLISIHCEKVVF